MSLISAISFLTGVKIVLFNLIFKHHISSQPSHRSIHMTCTYLLGIVSLFASYLSGPYFDRKHLAHPLANIVHKTILMVLLGLLFKSGNSIAKREAPPTVFDLLVVLIESLLIEETIRLD